MEELSNKDLSPEERTALSSILLEYAETGTSPTLENLWAVDYVEKPVDPYTFLMDEYYLGETGKHVYPVLVQDYLDIFNNPAIVEINLTGGIGWGKGMMTTLILSTMLYELSCLVNPQQFYNKPPGSSIVLMNMSVSAEQAKSQVFHELREVIDASPYFNEKFPRNKRVKTKLEFPNEIIAKPGNSSEMSAIGQHIYGGVVDEVNFFDRTENSKRSKRGNRDFDQAKTLVDALFRRLKNRFMVKGKIPGKLILLSSKTHEDSYLERRINNRTEDDKKHCKVLDYAEWDTKPKHFYLGPTFQVGVGNSKVSSAIIRTEKDIRPGMEIIDVPIEYKGDFETNLEDSIRDLAGKNALTVQPLIVKREKVYDCTKIEPRLVHPYTRDITDLEDGVQLIPQYLVHRTADGVTEPIINPDAPRYAHIDLSEDICATGLAVAHKAGEKVVKRLLRTPEGRVVETFDTMPVIYVDLMLQIIPPRGGEIDFSLVRGLLLELRNIGMPIVQVTFDMFQSRDSMQILEKLGFKSERLSMDRTPIPYYELKQAIYEERVAFYHYQPFIDEIVRLEDDRKAGKILKPEHGSKDVSDSVAGCVYSSMIGRSGWLAPSKGKTTDHFDKQKRKYKTDGKGNPVVTQETKEPDDIITDKEDPFYGRSRSRIEQLKKQYGNKGLSEDMKWLMR